ncbi:MAG: EAL domain-containing protein [Christensenellaceae bacterium]|jgi:lactose/cellobiose-specific phosphotransferase system IIC component|nr:EAL domain-containing protein [Christensenellaceae bacterium]
MEKYFSKIGKRFLAAYFKLENSNFFSCIRKGFISVVPIFLIGAFSLAIMNFPIPVVKDFIARALNGNVYLILRLLYESTFGLSALALIVSISYKYTTATVEDSSNTVPLMSIFVALSSYFVLLGITKNEVSSTDIGIFDFNFHTNLSVQSIFVALLCSILATRLFLFLCSVLEKIHLRKAFSGTDVSFVKALKCLIPMLLTIFFFALISILTSFIFNVSGISELINKIFLWPFEYIKKESFWSGLLIVLIQTIVWFFGIHGANAFKPTIDELLIDGPGTIITKTVLDNFILIGGCGASIGLLIAIFICSKNKPVRSTAKLSLGPMLFNINETMVYGLPIVYNPIYIIPFILTPIVNFILVYIMRSANLITIVDSSISWTTPVFLSGFLITGSVSGIVVQSIVIVISTLIYLPFVQLNDKLLAMRNARAIEILIESVKNAESNPQELHLLSGNDELSAVAREIVSSLRQAVNNDEIDIYYQPQIDGSGRAVSCEALLRWKHPADKFLFPPLVIALAKEDKFYERLNDYVVDKVLKHAVIMNRELDGDFRVSVNITATHFMDINYIRRFVDKVNALQLRPYTINIDVTEQEMLKEHQDAADIFALLRKNCIHAEIGDFNMAHTTLSYMRNHSFLYVKLESELVKKLLTNIRIRDIIKSIVQLGNQLEFKVIAEYVETEEQREILKQLGCHIYQGWLYSPAIPFNQLVNYVRRRNDPDGLSTKIVYVEETKQRTHTRSTLEIVHSFIKSSGKFVKLISVRLIRRSKVFVKKIRSWLT